MNWPSWSAFLHMGGYAFYVWGSFGVVALALLAEVMAVRARRRAAVRQLQLQSRLDALEEVHA